MRLHELAIVGPHFAKAHEELAVGVKFEYSGGRACGVRVSLGNKNVAVRGYMHVVRGEEVLVIAASCLLTQRHEMNTRWAELMDLVTIGFSRWIVATLIVAAVGYPHIAVVVYVNTVRPSDVTGTEAAH